MMRRLTRFGLMRVLTLVLSIVGVVSIVGCKTANDTELTVGLYPYVPRLEQFKTAIRTEWAKVQPTVSLKFISPKEWDGGYKKDPPANADVYVFDAMFFEYFKSKDWLEPMQASEVKGLNDFVKYAIDGVKVGEQYYAIPQLGCANLLFYQKDDTELANSTTLSKINSVLSQCTYTSKIPPDRRGLMLDMAGGTTNAALYLDTAHSLTGKYPFPLPWNESQINTTAMNNMRKLLVMASYENGTASLSDPYERAKWFSNGWGRAFIGYTESMSAMSKEMQQNIGFKVMPLSDDNNPPVFYADVIAVNTTTQQRGTRYLAVQLANVMAASATMVASIGPDSDNPYPQYLMATRPSVFQTLASSFPLYQNMYNLITDNTIMFNVSDQSRQWLDAMKNTISANARQNYPCACDYPTSKRIPNNSAAPPICEATCEDRGGWNGQWTNDPPAAPKGKSVCGCTACPVSSMSITK